MGTERVRRSRDVESDRAVVVPQPRRRVDRSTHQIEAPGVDDDLRRARGGTSHVFPAATRTRIQAASGVDLSSARVHDDTTSWRLNREFGTALEALDDVGR